MEDEEETHEQYEGHKYLKQLSKLWTQLDISTYSSKHTEQSQV